MVRLYRVTFGTFPILLTQNMCNGYTTGKFTVSGEIFITAAPTGVPTNAEVVFNHWVLTVQWQLKGLNCFKIILFLGLKRPPL